MTATTLQRKYTALVEYLQREAAKFADVERSEFFDGALRDMPFVSENHDSIKGNFI